MYSVKYADRTFYSQRNNPIDVYNKIIGKSGWAESCMCSAGTNAAVSVLNDYDLKEIENKLTINGIELQPEQIAWDILNDPKNWHELRKFRDISDETFYKEKIVPSRVAQYLPFVIKKIFNIESVFKYSTQSYLFDLIADNIIKNISSVILLHEPAHYVTTVKFDPVKNEIYCLDSFYKKYRILNKNDFLKNVRNFIVEVYPKKGE